MFRVLIDALDVWGDGALEDREDWVQLRTPSSTSASHNQVLLARISEEEIDARIEVIKADHVARGAGLRWVVGIESRPSDLAERLSAAGIPLLAEAHGMVRAIEGPPYPEPPPGVSVVPVTIDDCERLAEVTSAGWQRSPGFGEQAATWARRSLASQADDLRFWLAYDGDELVGSSVLRILPGLGYLQGGAVVPQARGRGIYRALTWARFAELHRRGIERVVIWADPRTSGPIARTMGFRPVTEASFHELLPAEE